jgi:hypothetical protein
VASSIQNMRAVSPLRQPAEAMQEVAARRVRFCLLAIISIDRRTCPCAGVWACVWAWAWVVAGVGAHV